MSWSHTLALLLESSGRWMLWNTILAWVPVGLAVPLFRRGTDRRRGPLWWLGVVVFGLFLPNAPYVVTDLIHVRPTIRALGPGAPVATTVVPLYAALVISGFVAYTLALGMAGGYLHRLGRDAWRLPLRISTHALVAIGIFLGRWPRLNSWQPFTDPRGTLHLISESLAWSHAPVLIAILFVVTALGHLMTRTVLGIAGLGDLSTSPVRGAAG
ncbi:MAG: DUF1361 domain-containing protein [Nocardioidaceae bacterium]|nr:DUF1361 domain-containing protein [Nocardioidaceae bacterium]MCL2613317.1 DUF1361 domain-containing protein [Nocardioidaceae bacterium]